MAKRDKLTRERRWQQLDDDLEYESKDLDRSVVSESQIRTVVRTFRDKLFTEIFPGRTEVPKTLIFAKDDSHAEDIVNIVREEFGRGNEFCKKITYRTMGDKPEDLIASFRNSYNPRIAVSVDMIATGTDIRPLECLLFMRDVKSRSYFEQMKGRGTRTIAPTDLKAVTSDIRPQRWTAQFTTELLQLLSVLEHTLAEYPTQAELLEAVLAGPLFTEDELPHVPDEARKPPKPPKRQKGEGFWADT